MFTPRHPGGITFSILLYWILCCPLNVFSHPDPDIGDTLSQQQFIKGCAAYRQSVMHDLEEVLTEFVNLSNGLAQISANPQDHYAFREMVLKGSLLDCHDKTTSSMYRVIQNIGLKDSMALRFYEQWLNANMYSLMELQFLISTGIVESKPPYKLGNLNDLWAEFSFYGLEANMTVADIGAGNGVISFILLESGLPINVIMTEIDEDFLTMLKTKIVKYSSRNELSSISLIRGTDKNLGLQDLKVDRIILREVFHHLKDPESILKDISLHLKSEGYLVLIESTKDLNEKEEGRCNRATTYKKIIKELDNAGYELEAEEIIADSFMLRFKYSG